MVDRSRPKPLTPYSPPVNIIYDTGKQPMTASQGFALELRHESSGYRHYLADRPVHTGTQLELLTDAGWITGRYEWSCNPDSQPYLITDADTDQATPLDEHATLRWPTD